MGLGKAARRLVARAIARAAQRQPGRSEEIRGRRIDRWGSLEAIAEAPDVRIKKDRSLCCAIRAIDFLSEWIWESGGLFCVRCAR